MAAIERKHGYTDDIVWSERRSEDWSDERWDRILPLAAAESGGLSEFESIRQRDGERAPRYVKSTFIEMRSKTKTGKRLTRWVNEFTTSYRRTADGLVVATNFVPKKGLHLSHHLWARDVPGAIGMSQIHDQEAFQRVVGEIPRPEDRFPLREQTGIVEYLERRGEFRFQAPWHVTKHFLDAENFAEVAKSMYGAKNYRRPLGRAVQEARFSTHAVLSQFRGLVPVDWIIDAYRSLDGAHALQHPRNSVTAESLRLSIRAFSEADRRRFLREIGRGEGDDALRDMTYETPKSLREVIGGRDLGRARSLGEAHEKISRAMRHARRDGHRTDVEKKLDRRTRGREVAIRLATESRDRAQCELEFGRALSDAEWIERADEWRARKAAEREIEHRAAMARRDAGAAERELRRAAERTEREKRIFGERAAAKAWRDEVVKKVHGLTRDGLTVRIAEDAKTLDGWADQMDHCIDTYASKVDIEVLGGIFRESDGKLMLNIAASQRRGVYQCLGKHNRPTGPATWPIIESIFRDAGAAPTGTVWGAPKDGVPDGRLRDRRPVEVVEVPAEAPPVLAAAH